MIGYKWFDTRIWVKEIASLVEAGALFWGAMVLAMRQSQESRYVTSVRYFNSLVSSACCAKWPTLHAVAEQK